MFKEEYEFYYSKTVFAARMARKGYDLNASLAAWQVQKDKVCWRYGKRTFVSASLASGVIIDGVLHNPVLHKTINWLTNKAVEIDAVAISNAGKVMMLGTTLSFLYNALQYMRSLQTDSSKEFSERAAMEIHRRVSAKDQFAKRIDAKIDFNKPDPGERPTLH